MNSQKGVFTADFESARLDQWSVDEQTRLLLWAARWVLTEVQDLYSGKRLPVQLDEEGYLNVPITLQPGEGQLLATDAASRQ